jgi:peptide/nickel transport system substrate-binding protein
MMLRPILLLLIVALTACAPAAPKSGQSGAGEAAAPAQPVVSNRPLNIAVRYEVNDLSPKRTGGASSTWTKRAFNASLALIDHESQARAYLAETLPQLNTDSWKVNDDGTMETTYRLRLNLTWHDGQPLVADDFVFANQVYTARGLGGTFTSTPQDQIEELRAPDARTVVIYWKSLYPQAGALVSGLLEPLPRHVLEAPFSTVATDPAALDTFLALPFWTNEYVGLGPYKLSQWLPGAAIEGVAFPGHALGAPKISRIVIKAIPDENTVLTNLLAGAVELAGNVSVRYEQAKVLKQQWDTASAGTILMNPGSRHWIFIQFRPDLLKTKALSDLRVRRALAHAVDRQPINEALFDGTGFMSDHWVFQDLPYAKDVDRAVTHYPFDARRVSELMSEAGFVKEASGSFVDPSGARFRPQYVADGSPTFVREMDIIHDTWNSVGLDMDPQTLPGNIGNLNEYRTTFPDMYASSTGTQEVQLDIFSSAQIATAAKRWAGNNRGGWENADFDRWWNAFNSTLDRKERDQQVIEMMKVATDQVPGIMLYFNVDPLAYSTALKGPTLIAPETLVNWNMHEWEWR